MIDTILALALLAITIALLGALGKLADAIVDWFIVKDDYWADIDEGDEYDR